jgi:hypothetical protein
MWRNFACGLNATNKIITRDTSDALLWNLNVAIKEKQFRKLRRGVLLLHDNGLVLQPQKAVFATKDCGSEKLNHPVQSLDIDPRDHFLFQNLETLA